MAPHEFFRLKILVTKLTNTSFLLRTPLEALKQWYSPSSWYIKMPGCLTLAMKSGIGGNPMSLLVTIRGLDSLTRWTCSGSAAALREVDGSCMPLGPGFSGREAVRIGVSHGTVDGCFLGLPRPLLCLYRRPDNLHDSYFVFILSVLFCFFWSQFLEVSSRLYAILAQQVQQRIIRNCTS